jgi:hypothetical protein
MNAFIFNIIIRLWRRSTVNPWYFRGIHGERVVVIHVKTQGKVLGYAVVRAPLDILHFLS